MSRSAGGSAKQMSLPAAIAALVIFGHAEAAMREIVLEGPPHQRGLQHGKILKPEIVKAVAAWKTNLAHIFHMDADEFIRKFYAKTQFAKAIGKYTPGLLEEVRGISEGSGVDYQAIFVYQLIDEYWANGKQVSVEHCSAIGLAKSSSHPSIVSQNMDLEGHRNGFQVLLHIKDPSGTEALVFSEAGLIALNGLNSHSVAVAVNTLSQLTDSRNGLPVAFVIRGLLEKTSAAEAVEFLKAVKHASGQNYLIGDKSVVYDYEASAGSVALNQTGDDGAWLYHTNHPLANKDLKSRLERSENSEARYSCVARRLRGADGANGVETVKSVLRSRDSEQHPVSRHWMNDDAPFTFGSAIMLLSERPEMLLTVGPPDQQEYKSWSFGQ